MDIGIYEYGDTWYPYLSATPLTSLNGFNETFTFSVVQVSIVHFDPNQFGGQIVHLSKGGMGYNLREYCSVIF